MSESQIRNQSIYLQCKLLHLIRMIRLLCVDASELGNHGWCLAQHGHVGAMETRYLGMLNLAAQSCASRKSLDRTRGFLGNAAQHQRCEPLRRLHRE
jgi:hypothetical protein